MSAGSNGSSGGAGFVARWAAAWRDPGFRWRLLATVPGLVLVLVLVSRVLQRVEQRPGAVLADPVLASFDPVEVSTPTFVLIYGSLVVALIDLVRRPRYLLRALMAYALTVLARIGMMWVIPLDPPARMIPLRDPLIETFGPGQLLTRDLFFSGHTSTLFLFALTVPSRWLKPVLYLATGAVAVLVLLQHVHYTIDVLVAPFVAFCAFRAADRLAGRESG